MVSSIDVEPPSSFGKVFLKSQLLFKPRPPPKDTNLSGHVVVITGANSGLGLECSRQLLGLNLSHLIMAVRTPEKGEAEAAPLRKKHPKATISVWPLDMTSYDSIQSFTRRIDTQLTRLDLTILNAGTGPLKLRLVPATGHEETIQVNYLSTALLAILLLPLLRRKAAPHPSPSPDTPATIPGRMSIISSRTAGTCAFPNRAHDPLLPSFDDAAVTPFEARERYGVSKLLGQMFVYKLVAYVAADDVVVNLAEPGLVKGTRLARDLSPVAKVAARVVMAPLARTVQQGVWGYLDAALVQGRESHGSFVDDREIKAYAPILYTPEGKAIADRLWEETMKELAFAGVREILDSMKERH